MVEAIMSIAPKWVKKILSGDKKYEFRKTKFKVLPEKVYIYETRPTQALVATFVPGEVIKDTPRRLWDRFGEHSGMTRDEFIRYYQDAPIGYAIEIRKVTELRPPLDPHNLVPAFKPPYSFMYVVEKW